MSKKRKVYKSVLDRILQNLRNGKKVTRRQLLQWGSANPSGHISLVRKKGEKVAYVRFDACRAFWHAPKHEHVSR